MILRGPSAYLCAISAAGSGHSGGPWPMHGANQRTFAAPEGNAADQRVSYPFRTARRRPSRLGHIHRQYCLMKLTAGVQRCGRKSASSAKVWRLTAWQERLVHDTDAMGKRWFKVTGSCLCEGVPLLAV